jgi:hypothetical protein
MKYILVSLTKVMFSPKESLQSFYNFTSRLILHPVQILNVNSIKQSAMSTIEPSVLVEATNSLTIEQQRGNMNAWTGPSTDAFDFRSMRQEPYTQTKCTLTSA